MTRPSVPAVLRITFALNRGAHDTCGGRQFQCGVRRHAGSL
jgi:hypothetical protein